MPSVRSRFLSLVLALVLATGALVATPAATHAEAATAASDASAVMKSLNKKRVAKGLSQLKTNASLTAYAQAYAEHLARGGADVPAMTTIPVDAVTGAVPRTAIKADYLWGDLSFEAWSRASYLVWTITNDNQWRDRTANYGAVGVAQTSKRVWHVFIAAEYPECAPRGLTMRAPSIAGTGRVGEILTAKPGASSQRGVSYSYEWRSGTTLVARTRSYVPVAEDLGQALTVTVEGNKRCFTPKKPLTSRSRLVTSGSVPTVTGDLVVNELLTANVGSWSRDDLSFEYQWTRGDWLIRGATGSTYETSRADVGQLVAVRITGSAPGYSATRVSRVAQAIALPSFDSTPAPVITGTPAVNSVLTAATGGWASTGATLGYQWRLDGVRVAGATAATFVPPLSAVGKTATVTMTATLDEIEPAIVVSAPSVPVAAIPFARASNSVIRGTPSVGKTLTASFVSEWRPYPALSYQWLRDGVPISGATSVSYKVTRHSSGHTLTIRTTARHLGYITRVNESDGIVVG